MREERENHKEPARRGGPTESSQRRSVGPAQEPEQEQILSIFDSIDEPVYVSDPDTYEVLFVNRAVKDYLGKDPTGDLCYVEFQGLEEPCGFCTNAKITADPERAYRWEHHNPMLDRDYLIVDRLIHWPDGRDVRFEFAMDITGLKDLERRLKESEEYFRAVTENVMDLIMIVDGEGIIKYVNRASLHVLGYEPGEMLGTNSLDFVHPDDLAWAVEAIREAVESGDDAPLHEIRARHRDGDWRYLEGVGRNFMSYPAVNGLLMTFRDISDRMRSEEDLRYSEEMHRMLVSISPDAVTMTDLQGKITFVSPQTLAMNGYESEDELLGESVLILIDPADHEKGAAVRRKTMRDGTVRNVELTGLRKGGKRFNAELNAALMRDARGEPKYLVTFTRDITERKMMEKELRDRNEELEAFAHTISHDLLTPVAIVEGYAKAALEADAEGRAEAERECLEAIARGARRMNDLITSLLQYAQAGHIDLESFGVDPEEVLMEVLMDLDEEIRRRKVRIELAADLPPARVNPVKLRQVFSNLIGNALKHMGDDPEPSVVISADVKAGTATFCVRDNGIGIPPDLHDKIFEPFRHFSLAGSQGLGIGLSTVKRAVTAWGGKVWVESTPGKGAAFFFTVPLAE